jgi:hypothetical protein
MKSVYSAVQTGVLNKAVCALSCKSLYINHVVVGNINEIFKYRLIKLVLKRDKDNV